MYSKSTCIVTQAKEEKIGRKILGPVNEIGTICVSLFVTKITRRGADMAGMGPIETDKQDVYQRSREEYQGGLVQWGSKRLTRRKATSLRRNLQHIGVPKENLSPIQFRKETIAWRINAIVLGKCIRRTKKVWITVARSWRKRNNNNKNHARNFSLFLFAH